MPTYVYKNCKTGERIELNMPVCEMERRQSADGHITLDDGTVAERVFLPTAFSMGSPRVRQGYPYLSYAMGVAPEQVPDVKSKLQKAGVSCDFDLGRPKITSLRHGRKVAKALGFKENNSYV